MICVPDGTRSLPVRDALLALRERLDEARVVVGLGLHRRMTAEELAVYDVGWPIAQHDPDACTDGVHPWVATAELVLCVGVVELHQYAGFSGGWKAAIVGCGAREVLASLHARAMVCHPDVQVGRLEGNPFRDHIDTLGSRFDGFALQWTGAEWVGGDPTTALRTAAGTLNCWEEVDGRWDRALLRVPPSKAVNLYQASRAATYLGLSARPPLNEGALLVLDAACPEGIGQGSGEVALWKLLAERRPWEQLLTGDVPSGAGVQRAFMLARLLQRYELVVAGCENPEALRRLGFQATSVRAEEIAGGDALEVQDPFHKLPQAT